MLFIHKESGSVLLNRNLKRHYKTKLKTFGLDSCGQMSRVYYDFLLINYVIIMYSVIMY